MVRFSMSTLISPSAPDPSLSAKPKALSLPGLFHLSIVYLVWSSTYLAIRVAVREGAGFAPFSLAALRCLAAMPILLLWARLQGKRIWPSAEEFPVLLLSGILLWTGGNALVVLAERRIDSGLAALLVSSTPIWVALLETFLDRRWPSWFLTGSLILGFLGTGLLAYPSMRGGVQADAWAILAALLGAFCWAGGSLLQRRRPSELDSVVSAAWQLFFGGIGVTLLSLGLGEPVPHPTFTAWLGFAFLLVFGSLFSFISFIKALRVLPTRVVFTYAYVNPVLAAFLGWFILDEHLGGHTVAGAFMVLVGVAGTFRAKQ
jgi:drug/metabolite transporter (DMT)-like permease